MDNAQTALLPLDLTYIDDAIIKYSLKASPLSTVRKVILMHVLKDNSGKDEVEYNGKLVSRKEMAKAKMLDLVEKHKELNTRNVEFEFIVSESNDPTNKILKYSKKNKVELIIAGKKNIAEGSGTIARLLTRYAFCTVLTVSENPQVPIKKAIVPIDFSEMSKRAMIEGINVAKRNNMELVILHVYALPTGYTASGKSPEEYASVLQLHAEKRCKNFLKQFDLEDVKYKERLHFDLYGNNEAKIISNISLVEDADLIVMGSRGRSALAATFIGSTTESLMKQHNTTVSTLVVKDRVRNLGLFGALLEM
ncbi:universal stress protein [Flammeovirga yaeyamensis]|uniref:Universal stress protein n=1 Tax=Flammeovirga yaeyamensis TaxID=367791 RepID=A0AAX1N620_9BACT|nr:MULTISPECIES: universal stress protein [Flammeovirga]ANQ49684.2 universal stress protein [Flammeovirga sp. MY04]MBB3697457.1 nucleotide-binding universal stress UspA family protein [Flammeovirga yaeyamensis]NMF36151.1 universal stress protein [Flammeovirga yaeyamensis]QWG02884.1 universal stress protein [Flammeovirga yaeyamensis]